MENKELAEQLRIAAEILETGKEWEFYSKNQKEWYKPSLLPHNYILYENEIRIKPWSLPAPPEGEQWHRDSEWKEGMLDAGERPLLDGETITEQDLFYSFHSDSWEETPQNSIGQKSNDDKMPYKTSRPLPQKKTKKIVPLGPEDVPMGSYIRHKTAPEVSWRSVIGLSRNGVASMEMNSNNVISVKFCSWMDLERLYLIKRPTDADFVPAHKEIEE